MARVGTLEFYFEKLDTLQRELDEVKEAIDDLNLEYWHRSDNKAYQLLFSEQKRLEGELRALKDTQVEVVR